MGKPEGFSAVPDAIERMAREAAGEPTTPAVAPLRPKLPVKESTKAMSVNVPKPLYDDLRNFMKLTDIPMTAVIIEGMRKELERLKKLHQIE
jgi:hypothetical protein